MGFVAANLSQQLEAHLREVDQRVARADVRECAVRDVAVEKLPLVLAVLHRQRYRTRSNAVLHVIYNWPRRRACTHQFTVRLHPQSTIFVVAHPHNETRPQIVLINVQRRHVILVNLQEFKRETRPVKSSATR
jgi:hypothetical protein